MDEAINLAHASVHWAFFQSKEILQCRNLTHVGLIISHFRHVFKAGVRNAEINRETCFNGLITGSKYIKQNVKYRREERRCTVYHES